MINTAEEGDSGHIAVGLECENEKLGYNQTRQRCHRVLNGDPRVLAVVENTSITHKTFHSLQEIFSGLGEIKLQV